ncbi:hypothetical protein, partial [Sphaerisporangium aureirubrum]
YYWALHTALVKHGVELPFPQRDLNLRSLFGHTGPGAVAMLRGDAVAFEPAMPPEAPPPSEAERAALADNDAQHDVEREAREEPLIEPPVAAGPTRNEER